MAGARATNEALDLYEVLAPLGSGGFASVHLARHLPTGREVALKISDPGGDPELVARALLEARILATIHHSSLVDVFDCGALPDGRVFVAMDRIEGVTLEALLEHEGGRLAPQRAVRLAVQALSALEQVHAQGVVHRDIKPANLLVRWDAAGRERLYVIDFGISKMLSIDVSAMQPGTMIGAILGTPGYMAPEQIDARTVDSRADVYGVAAVLYRAISGRKPYETKTIDAWLRAVGEAPPPLLVSVAPWVQPALAQVIDRALARDRDARPSSVRSMREALEAVLALDIALGGGDASTHAARTVETPVPPPVNAIPQWVPSTVSPPPAKRPSRVSPKVVAALGLLCTLVLVLGGWLAAQGFPAEKAPSEPADAQASLARGAAASSVKITATDLPAKLDEDEEIEAMITAELAPPEAPPARAREEEGTPEPSVEQGDRHARFVSATPVGDVDMDEFRGFARRALRRIDDCYDGTAPKRVSLLLLLSPSRSPMVSPLSDQSDVGRCTATALVSVIGRNGHSQGIVRDVIFTW